MLNGVTITNPWQTKKVVSALLSLPRLNMARVVFDEGEKASDYKGVLEPIAAQVPVMGCLLDSQFMKTMNPVQYKARALEYVSAFPQVPVWEVGNEINGVWLNKNPKKPDAMIKAGAAYDIVKAAKRKTALTLYHSLPRFQDPNGPLLAWVEKNVPAAMRLGLDYVWVSYYSQDNGFIEPSWAEWFDLFNQLCALFPNAVVGIGECGLQKKPSAEYIQRYYSMKLELPRFVGGNFYWYFCDQMLDVTKPMFKALQAAMQ